MERVYLKHLFKLSRFAVKTYRFASQHSQHFIGLQMASLGSRWLMASPSTGFAVVPRCHVQRYFDRWPKILNGSLYEMMRYGAPADLKLSPHFFGGSVFHLFDRKKKLYTDNSEHG